MQIPFSIPTRAKLASLYAGLIFGLYWIPLRDLVRRRPAEA